MDIRAYLDLMKTAEALKNNTRHSWTSSGRQESVAEHSWRSALMAFFLKDEFPQADMDRVVRMCLFHDMGEAFTGDIPSFYKTEGDELREESCIEAWLDTLPKAYKKELKDLFSEMEAQETLEARIYKAIDKLEVLIQHNEADLSTWIPLEYELNLIHGDKNCAFSPYLAALRQTVRSDSLQKIREKE